MPLLASQRMIPTIGRIRLAWSWPSIAVLAMLALAAQAFVHFREAVPEVRVVRSTVLPPEKTSFSDFGPVALSPDGRKMVFAATSEDGKRQLWIRAMDSQVAQPLAGTEDVTLPFWSPDSRWVAFYAASTLRKIDTAGGPPIPLAETAGGCGGSWSPNGTIVFSTGSAAGSALKKISAGGGATAPATVADGQLSYCFPWFLPDGEHFLFSTNNPGANGGQISLWTGSLKSTEASVFAKADSNVVYAEGRLLYVREGTLMGQPFNASALRADGNAVPVAERVTIVDRNRRGLFSVSGTGLLAFQTGSGKTEAGRQLTWFDRAGKRLETVGEPRPIVEIHMSADGRGVAATIGNVTGGADLWIYDLPRGLPRRFTSGPGINLAARWSPDSKTIAFSSTRGGHYDLYTKPVDGSRPEELLYADDQAKTPTNWSPDGKSLLYLSQRPAKSGPANQDVFLLPLTPERHGAPLKPVPVLQTDFAEIGGQFSPDGKWFAIHTNESQKFETYVAPLARPNEKYQVSRNGGTSARWRGRELFYLAATGQILAAEVRTGEGTVIVGPPRPVFGRSLGFTQQSWEVSPDGQRILAAVPVGPPPEPITLVQNWTAALKK